MKEIFKIKVEMEFMLRDLIWQAKFNLLKTQFVKVIVNNAVNQTYVKHVVMVINLMNRN